MNKLPRRPLARLRGAPPYILACHDFGELPPGHHNERYTICLTAPVLQLGERAQVPCLVISESLGLSWEYLSDPVDRQGCGKLVSWEDLPEGVRHRVYEAIDAICPLVTASWEANCYGDPRYLLAAAHGYGYYGSPEGYLTQKLAKQAVDTRRDCLVDATDPCVAGYRTWFEKKHKLGGYDD